MTGFDLKFETPFKAITIEINSIYPNISSYQVNVVFLISRIHLRFFYFITNYIEESFDSKALNIKGIQWITDEVKIADEIAINNSINSIKYTIEARIKKDIEEKFETSEPAVDDLPF